MASPLPRRTNAVKGDEQELCHVAMQQRGLTGQEILALRREMVRIPG
jgi:hypothetical protein